MTIQLDCPNCYTTQALEVQEIDFRRLGPGQPIPNSTRYDLIFAGICNVCGHGIEVKADALINNDMEIRPLIAAPAGNTAV